MYTKFTLISLLATLTTAVPTAVSLAPRCGTTLVPTILQTITESSPNAVSPNTVQTTSLFSVSQGTSQTNRVWQYVGFENIPAGATGCALSATFPSTAVVTSNVNGDTTQSPPLDVRTVYNGSPALVSQTNSHTWNNLFPATGTSPVGSGVFGTVTLKPGETVTINSEACDSALGFVFSVANWVTQSAAVQYTQYINQLNGAGLTGVYLTYNC